MPPPPHTHTHTNTHTNTHRQTNTHQESLCIHGSIVKEHCLQQFEQSKPTHEILFKYYFYSNGVLQCKQLLLYLILQVYCGKLTDHSQGH